MKFKKGEDVLLCVNGKLFKCKCGCNVFTYIAISTFKCNLCGREYLSYK